MRIASIVSAVALMAIATAGSALAAEPMATLDGITAQPLTAEEMDQVQGMGDGVDINVHFESDPEDPLVELTADPASAISPFDDLVVTITPGP